ncbi:MAG TPA: glycosyltransferase family A protein [Thermohalobaculum sp.]|nr:glycosyltransferase family A protein [Thermohalobaculum sp.]
MPTDARSPAALSVVIPHYEQSGILAATLDALSAQEDAPPFEVLVVDNGSRVPPDDLCRRCLARARMQVRLLRQPRPGPGPARNLGAATARAPLLAFLDADCVPEPDWLAAIARRFAGEPEADVLGGDVLIRPADPAAWTPVECYEAVYSYRQRLFIERDGYAATCNMAVRRAVFDAVGPFAGIGVAEDIDWGRRASAAGRRIVYAPEVRVRTPARAGFAELARKLDRHAAHEFAMLDAGPAAKARWALKTAAMAVSPLAEIPAVVGTDRLSGSRDRLRCLACLARTRLWRARRMAELLASRSPDRLVEAWRRAP